MKFNLFRKRDAKKVKVEEPKLPPKDFHPGRPSFLELLKNGNTVKVPLARK